MYSMSINTFSCRVVSSEPKTLCHVQSMWIWGFFSSDKWEVFLQCSQIWCFMLHVPILSRIRFTSVRATVTAVTHVAANLATLLPKCFITPFGEHDFTDALIDSQWRGNIVWMMHVSWARHVLLCVCLCPPPTLCVHIVTSAFIRSTMSDTMIMDAIASYLVLPNRLTVPLVADLQIAQLRSPLPRVTVSLLWMALKTKQKRKTKAIKNKEPVEMLFFVSTR